MGMLSDFFVASSEDALRYANRFAESDEGEEIEMLLKPAQYKDITSLELGTLWAILEGKEWDVEKHMPEDVEFGDDEESWLNRFPAELAQLLAEASQSELDSSAAAWANTEELDCNPEDLQPLLKALQLLAKDAVTSNKAVYLWGCL
jgi:hypothetical protein